MKKVIFIDRDGTILQEPADEQIDSIEKTHFVKGAISGLKTLAGKGYELVLVSNQDGLGTPSFPEDTFWPAHNLMKDILASEDVYFNAELIDRSFEEDNAPTRKPRLGMFGEYTNGDYDMSASYVIGDRESDIQLARNLGCEGILIKGQFAENGCTWEEAVKRIMFGKREAEVHRVTKETDVYIKIKLDGGACHIDSGLKFMDHMLEQISRHGHIGMEIKAKGDLEVDEHHTIEDIGLTLGECIRKALGEKAGINRYGFALPMDESKALVLLDFGGRTDFEWDVTYQREYTGDVPTEMWKHFFQSICNSAQCNLHISARGENEHHKTEAIFKAFARSLHQASQTGEFGYEIPSSKGIL